MKRTRRGLEVVYNDEAFFNLEFMVRGDERVASDAVESVEFNFSDAGNIASCRCCLSVRTASGGRRSLL